MKEFSDHEKSYKLLNTVLPKFDPMFAHTYIQECIMMEKKINDHLPFNDIGERQIKGVKGNSYLKINLREPIIQFVPHELQHFRHHFDSRIFKETDKQFTYAFIPSYIPTLNHLTLYVPYSSTIEEETSTDKDYDNFTIFQMKSKNQTPPSVDTLNRFEKQYAEKYVGIENKNIQEKIRMCFEFCYWNLPDVSTMGKIISIFPEKQFGFIDVGQKGMPNLYFRTSSTTDILSKGDYVDYDLKSYNNGKSEAINIKKTEKRNNFSMIHNFIYDRPSSIVDIVVPRKTIAKIDEINENDEKINLISETDPVIVRNAKVTFLIDTGDELKTKTQNMFVTKNVLDGLENGDLINCVLAKSISPKRSQMSFSNFVVVGKIGKKIVFDIKHFVALAAWKKLQKIDDNKSLCRIGSLSEFRKNVLGLITQIDFDMLKFIDTDKVLNDNINSAIENLFPLFILKDDVVYHNPPALIAHIANFYPDALEDKELMVDVSMLFDTFLNNQKDWGPSSQIKLRTHEYFEKVQLDQKGIIDLNHFISCIPSIANRVVYSRLLSQHWKQWISASD